MTDELLLRTAAGALALARATALKDSERSGEAGRVNRLCRPSRAREAERRDASCTCRRRRRRARSVDVVQRAGADSFFANCGRRRWRRSSRMDLELRELRGRGAIAGLLRTAVGGLSRALYPLDVVQRQRLAAPTTIGVERPPGRPRPAMELEDGPRSSGCCAQRLGRSRLLVPRL